MEQRFIEKMKFCQNPDKMVKNTKKCADYESILKKFSFMRSMPSYN